MNTFFLHAQTKQHVTITSKWR